MKLVYSPACRSRRRPSFTLVEMLVVIVIIGILATLLTVAAAGAMAKAKVTRIKTELDNIAGAFKAYKSKYGSYPPNFNDATAINQHLIKAFPRRTNDGTIPALNQAQAIYFWLSGFSADVTRPLTGPGGPLSSTPGTNEPLFDFVKDRLNTTGTAPYTAATMPTFTASGMSEPYVYFDTSRVYSTEPNYASNIQPYRRKLNAAGTSTEYVEPQGFQVLSAGIDNDWRGSTSLANQPKLGTGAIAGDAFTGSHADNLGSFTQNPLGDQ